MQYHSKNQIFKTFEITTEEKKAREKQVLKQVFQRVQTTVRFIVQHLFLDVLGS